MGQTDICKLLIVGAMSRIRWIVRKGVTPDWLGWLVGRKPRMVAACLRKQDGQDHLGDYVKGTGHKWTETRLADSCLLAPDLGLKRVSAKTQLPAIFFTE
jgi:hypothetical protein